MPLSAGTTRDGSSQSVTRVMLSTTPVDVASVTASLRWSTWRYLVVTSARISRARTSASFWSAGEVRDEWAGIAASPYARNVAAKVSIHGSFRLLVARADLSAPASHNPPTRTTHGLLRPLLLIEIESRYEQEAEDESGRSLSIPSIYAGGGLRLIGAARTERPCSRPGRAGKRSADPRRRPRARSSPRTRRRPRAHTSRRPRLGPHNGRPARSSDAPGLASPARSA